MSNSRAAVLLVDHLGAPFCKVSVNVSDAEVKDGEIVVQHDLKDDLAQLLLASGLFVDTGRTIDYGYVAGQPVWQIQAPR
jgi:formylmethanofuran dehydrogenase subunit A